VMAGTGAALWWERQLPARLQQAAARGDLEACLRYGNQLEALRWRGGQIDQAQSSCRRRRARLLWERQQWAQALQLQLQLVNSGSSERADEQQLITWQEELQRRALLRYRDGDLKGALAMLAAMGEDRRADGTSVGDRLREGWTRNTLNLDRASKLAKQTRWFEALESLNRIDHPWWKNRSLALRREVESTGSRMPTAACPTPFRPSDWMARFSGASRPAWMSGAPSRAPAALWAGGLWRLVRNPPASDERVTR
jgi:hypothetical protein